MEIVFDTSAPLTMTGLSYRRFLFLLDFLILQSDDIIYHSKSVQKEKMKQYKSRLDWIKKDMATSIPSDAWEAIKTHLEDDKVQDLFLLIDKEMENG